MDCIYLLFHNLMSIVVFLYGSKTMVASYANAIYVAKAEKNADAGALLI